MLEKARLTSILNTGLGSVKLGKKEYGRRNTGVGIQGDLAGARQDSDARSDGFGCESRVLFAGFWWNGVCNCVGKIAADLADLLIGSRRVDAIREQDQINASL